MLYRPIIKIDIDKKNTLKAAAKQQAVDEQVLYADLIWLGYQVKFCTN